MASEVNQVDSEEREINIKKIQEGQSLAKYLEWFFLNAGPSAERSQKI